MSLKNVGEAFRITKIHIETDAKVADIDSRVFHEQAEAAKKNCPVSAAFPGTKIALDAKLTTWPTRSLDHGAPIG
ncbi:MAG: hypothetical protein O7H41_16050 [Planctomycetota bacterium]|nr:hypothetical protein [Planctomycetota bacterium]